MTFTLAGAILSSADLKVFMTQFLVLFNFRSVAKEDLISKPAHDYVLPVCDILSEGLSVLFLDLNTVQVEELEENQSEFIFSINKDAVMHGFGTWFEVGFCPLGPDVDPVILSTSPFNE